jgi:hypothetical protein
LGAVVAKQAEKKICDVAQPSVAPKEDVKPQGAGEGIPFVITAAMKVALRARGYGEEAIANMRPAEAHKIIEEKPEIRCKPYVPEPDDPAPAPRGFRIKEGEPEYNSFPVEELLKAKKPKRTEEEWIADLLARPQRGLGYAKGLAEASAELGYSQKHIEDELKERRGKKPEKDDGTDPKQSSKLLAIGLGGNVRLWHSPEGVGYASVLVDEQRDDDGKIVVGEHWENYQLNGKAFKGWLRTKYGDTHRVKIGDAVAPQAVSDGALKDAISSLEGYASRKPEAKPAVRVGRCNGVVWIDLGGPDWSAVKVTATGWNVVQYAELPGVAFVRPKTMLALPSKPVKGGDIRRLTDVLNVRDEQFVLAVGWLLQCLNPVGPYPLVYPIGEAELGKTTTTKLLCRTVDPNSVQLRRKNRVEDLLIAAKNNWVVGFDNCSSITPEWSDTLSMLATGIGVGKRANYTDDEEHSFVVERPVAFNGIPGDLTERADLASRTIKLDVPALAGRRSMADLEKAFDAIWPGVFGALLDGIVGALAGADAIDVTAIGLEPARLMDFERWAEAGCRAIGFADWAFVRAYDDNRAGSMADAAEAHPVGRAVMEFMEKRWAKHGAEPWRGKMEDLLERLKAYRGDAARDPTRLSGALRRLRGALATMGFVVQVDVDLRAEYGTQKGVVMEWARWLLEKHGLGA